MAELITLFLSGDVMTGRGIDQVLSHPVRPTLHEPFIKDARDYVRLAEKASGTMPGPVDFPYIWGDALDEWARVAPDLRIINLETSITTSNTYFKDKEVHYRMNPQNVPCLTAAGIDCCALANNHILDWGYAGLTETLATLKKANIKSTGAGQNIEEAEAPAVMEVKTKGRVIVFSYGSVTSGVPRGWAASPEKPGVNLLKDFSDKTVRDITKKVQAVKQKGDTVVFSIHWGGNWGYQIPSEQVAFARKLIDRAEVDLVYGHSSHHVKGIEMYKNRLILYGCGDFLNDYEGIRGYEVFRGDLGLMYFATVDTSSGELASLRMTPTQIKHFRVNRAPQADALWLKDTLNREGARFGTKVELSEDNTFTLQWR